MFLNVSICQQFLGLPVREFRFVTPLQRCARFVHSFLLPISGKGIAICDPLIIFSTLTFVNILQGVIVLVTPFYGLTFRTIPASLHHFCQSLFKVLEMLGYFFTCNLDIYQHPAAVRLPLVTVSGRAAALFVVLERCNAESVFSLVSIRDPQRLPFSFRWIIQICFAISTEMKCSMILPPFSKFLETVM